METRTVEFFEKKVEQIDAKIEKCFKAFEEGSEHMVGHSLNDGAMKTKARYVGVYSMCTSIEALERLRKFYSEKIKEAENPIDRAIRLKRDSEKQ